MAVSDIVARRYAEAFYAVAGDLDQVAGLRGQLAGAVEVVSDPRVASALANPRLPARAREQLLEMIPDAGPQMRNLVRLLLERRRIAVLPTVLSQYDRLVDRDAGVVRAEVITAIPVDDRLEGQIRQTLAQRFGSAIQTFFNQDPSIIGGLVIRIGDRVIDTSVRTRLEQLRAALA
jgi:F-type H+-transporting ATPase subunit delta